jgi:hypothetical protein
MASLPALYPLTKFQPRHAQSIYAKLGVASREAAVKRGRADQLI